MSFDPVLYTLLHRGSPGDLAFYRRVCADAGAVLELGCGDGRVLAGLRAPGRALVGLDAHPGMIEAARDRLGDAATLVVGDMADFDLGRRFDRVVVPFTGFYCLPDDDAMVACLRAVRRHLAPGGRFVFDAYPGEPLLEVGDFEPSWEVVTQVMAGERRWQIYERDRNQPAQRRIDVSYRHVADDGAVVEYTLRHHYLTADDVPRLLAAAGLRLRGLWGDFVGGAFDPDGERLVVSAER